MVDSLINAFFTIVLNELGVVSDTLHKQFKELRGKIANVLRILPHLEAQRSLLVSLIAEVASHVHKEPRAKVAKYT